MSEIGISHETDVRVATEVLGLIVAPRHCCGAHGFGYSASDHCPGCDFVKPTDRVWVYPSNVSRYSNDPGAALVVVEHLRRAGWLMILKAMPNGLPFLAGAGMGPGEGQEIQVRYVVSGQWMRRETAEGTRRSIHAHPVGLADTLALAVCRCALECVRVLEDR